MRNVIILTLLVVLALTTAPRHVHVREMVWRLLIRCIVSFTNIPEYTHEKNTYAIHMVL